MNAFGVSYEVFYDCVRVYEFSYIFFIILAVLRFTISLNRPSHPLKDAHMHLLAVTLSQRRPFLHS